MTQDTDERNPPVLDLTDGGSAAAGPLTVDPQATVAAEVADDPQNGRTAAPKRRFRRLRRWLIRLLLVAVLVTAALLAWPQFNDRVLRGVATNSAKLGSVDRRLAQTESDLETLTAKDGTIASLTDRLAKAEAARTALQARIDGLATSQTDQAAQLRSISGVLASLDTTSSTADAEIRRQLQTLKVLELLSRARSYLYQANYGLAAADVASARAELAVVQPDPASLTSATLGAALARLDLVTANIDGRPVLAANDLDIAWRIVVDSVGSQSAVTAPTAARAPDATVPASGSADTPDTTSAAPAPTAATLPTESAASPSTSTG